MTAPLTNTVSRPAKGSRSGLGEFIVGGLGRSAPVLVGKFRCIGRDNRYDRKLIS